MIRKSIEPGTEVFHLDHGFGKIVKYNNDETFCVEFENFEIPYLHRKELTEIENKPESFDPPV